MDSDGWREITLVGNNPNWTYLLSEILRVHGFPCRTVSDPGKIRIWMKGNRRDFPLLIVEEDPEGLIPEGIREIHSAFPALTVIPIPSDFKPSELFRFIDTALLILPGYGETGSQLTCFRSHFQNRTCV